MQMNLKFIFIASALSAALSHYETIKSTYVRTRARARARVRDRGRNKIKSEAWAGLHLQALSIADFRSITHPGIHFANGNNHQLSSVNCESCNVYLRDTDTWHCAAAAASH